SDGQGANTAATQGFSLAAVNDAPLAVADALAAAQETPVTYSAPQLLGNDGDGDPELTQTLAIASVTSGIGGVAALDLDGSVTFTPATGFSGPANFTYTVSDGALDSVPATVTVDISPDGNDAPELTLPPATLANGTEDYPYSITAADLLQGYTDANGDTPLLVRELAADHGTVVDNGLGTYTITPTANYNGPMALSYTVSD
ncbi:MAG: cadherin-like domain-containing protein, partial [Deltaproteobacteria bacterium]